MRIECGGYHDNVAVIQSAEFELRMGRVRKGLKVLDELEAHILRTGESKSVRYLLGNIEFYRNFVKRYGGFANYKPRRLDNLKSAARRLFALGGY
jgi:hypothetical protein